MTDKTDKKKEMIIRAAMKCFRQYGYLKSTFGDIAKEAGISRALIYSYFKDKRDIFITINSNLQDRWLAMSEEIVESDCPDEEKLFKIIDIWIIDSYRVIRNSIYGIQILDGLVNISEQNEKRFRKLFIKSIESIVGEDVAEVIVFSIRGLMSDRPTVKTLQKRIGSLIKTAV
jgi:AcrR family transcriptional regulator